MRLTPVLLSNAIVLGTPCRSEEKNIGGKLNPKNLKPTQHFQNLEMQQFNGEM
jgi:hypothetical protein